MAVCLIAGLLPTAALAAGSETEENYVTLELTYSNDVTEEDQSAAKSQYENKKYENCTEANEAYMALYGVTWDNGYLDVTNREAPLYAYIDQAGSVTNVTFKIHGKVEGFDSLQSNGNQIDCTVGGNHQIFRTSYTIQGVNGADGSKAAITDGNVQAYVAGGYYGNDGKMFADAGTLTVDNIEFLNTDTTTIAASCNVDSGAVAEGKAVKSAGMVIKDCTFHGLLYLYSNFLNDDKMEYTVENCDFIGTESSQSYAIFLQNTNATADLNYGPSKLTLSGNTISGYQRGINLHNASTEVQVKNNEISTAPGYSAVQITACTAAEITDNKIHLDNSNVLTLHELLAGYDGVEVTVSNNTIDGNGYLIYDDVAANGGALTSDKLTLTLGSGDTANTVTGTLDTTKGVKGDAATDLIGYVAAVVRGDNVEDKVAEVGGVYYGDLAKAFAALNETNHTLTLLDGNAWTGGNVYWQAGEETGYADTLADALKSAYMANAGDITIVCRPGADVGTMTHGHVADNITLYGNNAYISGGECDLEVDTYKFDRTTGAQSDAGAFLSKDITITAYELDNLGVWGQRNTAHKVTVNLTDCDGREISGQSNNQQRVYISGTSGENDITLTGCNFLTKATSVYSNADGKVVIDNCSFTGGQAPVNFNHEANGTQTVTVKNSTFTNCGSTSTENKLNQYAAPIRFVNSGSGTSTTTVDNCTFNNTVGSNGDTLIGDGRDGKESKDVSLTVKNTAANVQAQKPGYYNGESPDVTKMMAKQVAKNETLETSVNKLLPNAAKIGGTEYATLKEALESLSNTTEKNVTIELLADQNVAGFTVDLSNSAINTLTIQGNGKKLDSHVNGVDIDGKNGPYCPVINAKLPANATFSVDGIVAPNSLLFDTGSEASLVVKNSTFNESQTGYPAAKNITYQGNTFEFKSDASKYYTNNAFPIWYKTENTTRSIAFLNNKVTGPRGFHIETRSKDADKKVNIKANGNTFNLSDSSEYKNKTIALQLVANLNGEIEFKDNQVNAYMGVCFFKGIAAQDDSKLTIKNNYTSGKLYGSSEWNADGKTPEEKIAAADNFAKKIVEGRESANNGSAITEGHTHNYVNDKCTICGQTAPSGGGSSDPTYSVSTPSKTENGTVTVSPKSASKGDTVTITVDPDEGYVLDELTVTDSKGEKVELTKVSDTKYTFTMPRSRVTIEATFVEDPDYVEPDPSTSVADIFDDIQPGAWYEDAVQFAYDEGIMTGTSKTTFEPNTTTTRGMIVSILHRLEGNPVVTEEAFSDVSADDWYGKAVAWASSEGIVGGYGDGTFQPNKAITREEMASILYRYAQYKDQDVSARADLTKYTDADQVGAWAEEVMQWANAEGLINGMTEDTLVPQGNATRAQVAAMFQRYLNK